MKKDKFWNTGKIFLPLFDKEIELNIEFDVDDAYAEQCAYHMVNLSDSMIDEFCTKAIKYYEYMQSAYEDFYEVFGKFITMDMTQKIEGREILKYIEPTSAVIYEPEELIPAFSLEFDCGWEAEHGLELIVRGDKVLYAASCDGLGPWADDEEYYCIWDDE